MRETGCLSGLEPDCEGVVTGILASGDMRARLLNLGFTEGARVTCLQKSPLGDPTAYGIRGAVIALRAKDASLVSLKAPE